MTWIKFGTEFSDEVAAAGRSDAAYRTLVEAMGWLYRIEQTSLHISKHLVRRFAGSPCWPAGIDELVAAGFWKDHGDYWEVLHHADVIRQSLTAQLRHREMERNRQRAKRQGKP